MIKQENPREERKKTLPQSKKPSIENVNNDSDIRKSSSSLEKVPQNKLSSNNLETVSAPKKSSTGLDKAGPGEKKSVSDLEQVTEIKKSSSSSIKAPENEKRRNSILSNVEEDPAEQNNMNELIEKENVSIPPEEKKDAQQENSQQSTYHRLAIRGYFERTVLPVIMDGMTELSKERPDNPIEFLGQYILKRSKQK